jgi:hypothetical protein
MIFFLSILENDSQLVASLPVNTFRDTHTEHELVLNVTVTLANFFFFWYLEVIFERLWVTGFPKWYKLQPYLWPNQWLRDSNFLVGVSGCEVGVQTQQWPPKMDPVIKQREGLSRLAKPIWGHLQLPKVDVVRALWVNSAINNTPARASWSLSQVESNEHHSRQNRCEPERYAHDLR